MGSRQQFEEWALTAVGALELADLRFVESRGEYYWAITRAMWEAWQASRESLVVELPEITKEHVHFALDCQLEDPSDDEEIGFCEGVSWCIAFTKQQMAKREKK